VDLLKSGAFRAFWPLLEAVQRGQEQDSAGVERAIETIEQASIARRSTKLLDVQIAPEHINPGPEFLRAMRPTLMSVTLRFGPMTIRISFNCSSSVSLWRGWEREAGDKLAAAGGARLAAAVKLIARSSGTHKRTWGQRFHFNDKGVLRPVGPKRRLTKVKCRDSPLPPVMRHCVARFAPSLLCSCSS